MDCPGDKEGMMMFLTDKVGSEAASVYRGKVLIFE